MLLTVALTTGWLLTGRPIARGDEPPARSPNLLLIIADDHAGWTLGIQGDPHHATPNLDTLGRSGVAFKNAFCNSPLCTASRQSLITGKLPHSIGVTQLTTPLSDREPTLGTRLRDIGYDTAAIGKMHFNGPSSHGFNERIDQPDWVRWLKAQPDSQTFSRRPWHPFQDPAAVWLNSAHEPTGLPARLEQATFFTDRAIERLAKPRNRPLALVVSYYEPHSPFNFPNEWKGRFKPDTFPVRPVSETDRLEQPEIFTPLTPEQVQGIQAAYYTSLAYVDSEIGRLLKGLDDSGHRDDTLVVYLGDHGYMLGHHGRFEKHCLYEPAIRAPLLMRWPGRIEPGRTIDAMVEFIDVQPTLFDLLGLPMPDGLQGMSLAPLVRGEPSARGRDLVFSEYSENEEAMVRTKRYKLIVGTGRRQRQDGYQTGRPLPGPYERLFDLEADPNETHDLSADPAFAALKEMLESQLLERMTTTRDVGKPVPPGLSRLEAIHFCLAPTDPPGPAPVPTSVQTKAKATPKSKP
jgi:choline-sulfatase